MSPKRQHIRVFEHQAITLNQKFEDEVVFDQTMLDGLIRFFENGKPYFSLIRNGVQFNEYVGALQVGNLLISVLPKADKAKEEGKDTWNQVLIDMIRAVHGFEVKAPSTSSLKVKNNSVLDLYFELFLAEVEYLLHRGLVKKYRKTEGNLTALKGSIQFGKHISQNVVHKERFYTRYTTYDTEHLLHVILHQTILVLHRINTNSALLGRINSLLLNFPEMPSRKITETVFDKLIFNRKTEGYRKAIDIARMILLHYHPDLSNGHKDVLALMFDMNVLWEKFVLVSLKKHRDFKASGQASKYFWKPEGGWRRSIRPDIIIESPKGKFILDTKWKMVDNKPSMDDLRQMFAYLHYFEAEKAALFFPGTSSYVSGKFENLVNFSEKESGLLFTKHVTTVKSWQKEISEVVSDWISKPKSETK